VVKAEIPMSNYFTYQSTTNGYIVRWPVNTRIKFNNSYRKLLGLAFNVTKGHQATVLTADNRLVTISLSLYAQLPDDDLYIPHTWKHVAGIYVDTEEQAQQLVDELDKERMWALLRR
jgi:hypothetical protein